MSLTALPNFGSKLCAARPRAAQLVRHAARRLREQGLPLQDVGKVLGVSFQRAKQLIDEADKLAS
jgi:hypothetical protein